MQVLCSVLCDVCDGQEIDTVSTDVLARSTLLRDAKQNNWAGNLEICQPVFFLGKADSRAYCCRNGGIGKGMLKVFAPTPTPPWQELGGVVQMFLVEGHSAAQNM